MTALLILNYDVIDLERLENYRRRAAKAILGATGQLITSTIHTLDLNEGAPTGSSTVIIEYPSREEAERRYSSHAYQTLLTERLAATIPRTAFIVDMTEARLGLRPLS